MPRRNRERSLKSIIESNKSLLTALAVFGALIAFLTNFSSPSQVGQIIRLIAFLCLIEFLIIAYTLLKEFNVDHLAMDATVFQLIFLVIVVAFAFYMSQAYPDWLSVLVLLGTLLFPIIVWFVVLEALRKKKRQYKKTTRFILLIIALTTLLFWSPIKSILSGLGDYADPLRLGLAFGAMIVLVAICVELLSDAGRLNWKK